MMDGRKRAILALLAALLILAWSPQRAATDAPPGYLAWKQANWLAEVPPLPVVEARQTSLAAISAGPSVQSWSAMVFQSGRDGNWEIYLANGDGSSARRLTDHPANDLYPRLNRGATRIVFASDRDGNLELYTMNVDGSSLTRLTYEPAADSYPAWSPDGRRIAFASRRDTDWDLYVMDADGTDVVRLTTSPDDDVQPCWSPDGASIAWIRRVSSSQAELYRIGADGTNGRLIQPGCNYMQHPSWSTDGKWIAYDCDVDGDYFNEIVVTTESGWGRTNRMDPSGGQDRYEDAWLGSYAPKDDDLVATIVYWEVAGNQLVLSHTAMRQLNGAVVSSSDLDMAPDWTTADVQPPRVTLDPAPRFIKGYHILYSWSGIDAGPAGLRSYEVQIRDQTSDWRTWLENYTGTSFTCHGGYGYTYRARVRACDYAGNCSAWGEQHLDGTTCYRWMASGSVIDERGFPVPFAQVRTNPPVQVIVPADGEGRFAVYGSAEGVHQLQVNHPGYADAMPISFAEPAQDPQYTVTLWHADERITNGGAETGSLLPWQGSGEQTPAAVSLAASGHYSFRIGQVITAELYAVPGSPDTRRQTTILRDAQGTYHALRNASTVSGPVSYYLRLPPGGSWTEPQTLTDAGRWASLTLDGTGNLHTIGVEKLGTQTDYALVHKRRAAGGEWSPASRIPGVVVGGNSVPVALADSSGNVHVLWDCFACAGGGTSVLATRLPDGRWTQAAGPPVRATTLPERTFALAMTQGDVLHAVWHDGTAVNSHDDRVRLMYSKLVPQGQWSAAVELAASAGREALRETPVLLAGQGDVLYVLWLTRTYVGFGQADAETAYFRRSVDAGLTWEDTVHIASWDSYLKKDGATPVVALDELGTLHALWDAPTEHGSSTFYTQGSSDGRRWSTPIAVGSRLGPSSAAARGEGSRLWVGGETCIALTGPVTERQGASYIEQSIDLTQNAHAPTLSLVYRYAATPDSEDKLVVRVDGAEVWRAAASAATWQPIWLDLSAWKGTTATLTIGIESQLDGDRATAWLDDIVLGSWRTPIIGEVTPPRIDPLTAVTVTVSGANLLPGTVQLGATVVTPTARADGTELLLALPAGFPTGRHSLWIVNQGGQEGYIRSALVSGWFAQLPLVVNK